MAVLINETWSAKAPSAAVGSFGFFHPRRVLPLAMISACRPVGSVGLLQELFAKSH
jgi:hypothetical protein